MNVLPDLPVESILDIRHLCIYKLLDIPYSKIDEFGQLDRVSGSVCRYNSLACDAMTYGSLALGLYRIGLWPRKTPEEIHLSVKELGENLRSLSTFYYLDDYSRYGRHAHQSCSSRHFKTEISEVLSHIPDPVLDSHRRHMETQRTGGPKCVSRGSGKESSDA